MRNKIIIATLLTLTITLVGSAVAQNKILESSAKKTPAWIGASGGDAIVANAQGTTLEQAKEGALASIKRQMIEAVALNIKAESENKLSQTSGTGGEITEFNQTFEDKFATRAAKLPFINGISLSNATEYYWEKVQDKTTKQVTYGYSVQYPFSKGQLHKLTNEFMKIDNEMTAKLKAMEDVVNTFTTTEELETALSAAPLLYEYFFDDVRIAKTKAAETILRKQFDFIRPTLAASRKGEAISVLTVGNRTVTTNTKPTLKSNCAMALNYKIIDNQTVVTYDDEGCLDGEENYIEISYRFGGKKVADKIFFSPNDGMFKGSTLGTAVFKFAPIENEPINKFTPSLTLQITSNGVPVIIEKASIESPLTPMPIMFDNQNITVDTKGESSITLTSTEPIVLAPKKNALQFVKGMLFVRTPENGEVVALPVNLKYALQMHESSMTTEGEEESGAE